MIDLRGKKILVAQPAPKNNSPYAELETKYRLSFDFCPFFTVNPVSTRSFRGQHVNILDYTAIVFTSRSLIDSFFHICEETRVTVPEDMKYFCQNQQIALYLQKYIVYRKRKIFFGDGKPLSVVNAIGAKHKNEKFLIACTDGLRPDMAKAFETAGLKYGSAVFMNTVVSDIKHLDLSSYSALVCYSPCDVRSLLENFPEFKQENLLLATFGVNTAKAARDAGLNVEIMAPTPEAPSIAQALNLYCSKL
ncbi:MAG: uroporphyrinogen-III synthase [Bacteroidales bacterium]|nr:uroporphyrinogen-III synthase [Bacteroidales bacterium]MBQ6082097.1 uroporphyrinogen-III synthase [Bacteroidales bacterium]MBQ7459682.1 uroporphyrinogen-III synthase [Bacteroidales bacterium]